MDNIKKLLRKYLIETFDIDENDEEFTDDIDFFTYGYVDSFGAEQIISFMEEEFKITVSDKDLVKYPMTSVDEIAAYIETKREAAK